MIYWDPISQTIRDSDSSKEENINLALDKLWTEAQSKVETKVADTKFLMLRDVLAKEGKDFPRKIS